MPKTKRKRQAPHERPYVSNLELREALAEKLTDRELNALEKQIRTAVEIATERAVKAAVEETYKRHWSIAMRVLHDRFGWGKGRIRQLWDACQDYLKDMDKGILTTQNMLDTLEHEDGIRLTWSVDGEQAQ